MTGTASDHTHAPGGVLVVDDDMGIRGVLTQLLQDEGHRVASAANGQEALERLAAQRPPGVILLDLMMPVMNGWEFMNRRRDDERIASIPVIVISADGQVREKANAIGAVGYLTKPIDLDRLLDTVERYCAC